jgi:hypothetical protein
MHDAANDTPIIRPLNASYIAWLSRSLTCTALNQPVCRQRGSQLDACGARAAARSGAADWLATITLQRWLKRLKAIDSFIKCAR